MNDAITATQQRLDATADRAWQRMQDTRGTALFDMCRDLAYAAKDRADSYAREHAEIAPVPTESRTGRFRTGYQSAVQALDSVPGPLIAWFLPILASMQPEPDDDPIS
ncbi:hypothetical protein ABLE92_06655 [Gordonia sp. VNQ95]|uniref:hypothetical protein n=1 Tax=Gordonia sp. VNQ95 TaxID=3156619 RepID=UPI0032B6008B